MERVETQLWLVQDQLTTLETQVTEAPEIDPDDVEVAAPGVEEVEEVRRRVANAEENIEDLDVAETVSRVETLEEEVEFLYRWIGLAEIYLKSTRYLFEHLGLDFEAAMDDTRQRQNRDSISDDD